MALAATSPAGAGVLSSASSRDRRVMASSRGDSGTSNAQLCPCIPVCQGSSQQAPSSMYLMSGMADAALSHPLVFDAGPVRLPCPSRAPQIPVGFPFPHSTGKCCRPSPVLQQCALLRTIGPACSSPNQSISHWQPLAGAEGTCHHPAMTSELPQSSVRTGSCCPLWQWV